MRYIHFRCELRGLAVVCRNTYINEGVFVPVIIDALVGEGEGEGV